jgi:uncharacterized protein (DUF362 family)
MRVLLNHPNHIQTHREELAMKGNEFSRREFLRTSFGVTVGAMAGFSSLKPLFCAEKPVVSVVKIENDKIGFAVEKSIDLLGGIESITRGKQRIILKPNLVSPDPRNVTKPDVIKALAQLMKGAGKDVSIGEGSAAAGPNYRPEIFGKVCRTKDIQTLNNIQQSVFDTLGYSDLAKSLKTPLVNLHTGEMSKVKIPKGFVYKEISLHHSLTETDLLCSVPMMKTHGLASVTLGMKNLFGVYPGQVYGTVRSAVHIEASKVETSGTASAIVDMVQANRLGLVVVDASTAMQGQGPSVQQGGQLIKMDLIIAGTNPLATDMAAAYIMGFQPEEVSTFSWAWKAGMTPVDVNGIEIRGEKLNDVRRTFLRPTIYPWDKIKNYGPPC